VKSLARRALLVLGLIACHEPSAVILPPGTHHGYYVRTTGTPGGTGADSLPWDLATALAGAGGVIHPGDTIWIRQGVYRGAFETDLLGTVTDHVLFRAYPGERVTINGSLKADGEFLTFWGLEIMQSNPLFDATYVLRADTRNGRFINLVLHDAGVSGVSLIKDRGDGVELYGCLIYNNGMHENVDHGIYAHNQTDGSKAIVDNVLFNNYARGVQVYADGDLAIRDILVEGNIAFNNGAISAGSTPVNLLVSATVPTSGMVVRDNLVYSSPGTDGIGLRVGDYDSTYNQSIVVERNYVAGGATGLEMRHRWLDAGVRDNTFAGSTEVVRTGGTALGLAYSWTGNRYYRDPAATGWEHDGTGYDFASWKAQTGLGAADQVDGALPAAARVVVRPNRYEPGRAHVAVYNWPRAASVSVDLSAVLRTGDRYEVRNVQDVFGVPVVAGTFDGTPVAFPMTGVAPPAPIGRSTPRQAPRTGPEFDAFLVTTVSP
jgi:hypothetical protein